MRELHPHVRQAVDPRLTILLRDKIQPFFVNRRNMVTKIFAGRFVRISPRTEVEKESFISTVVGASQKIL